MKIIKNILIAIIIFSILPLNVFASQINSYDNLDAKKLLEFQYNPKKLGKHWRRNKKHIFDYIKAVKKRDWRKVIESQTEFDAYGYEILPRRIFPAVLGAFSDSDLKGLFEQDRGFMLFRSIYDTDTDTDDAMDSDYYQDYVHYFHYNKLDDPTSWFFRHSFYRSLLSSMGAYCGNDNQYDAKSTYNYSDSVKELEDIKDLKPDTNWKMDIAKRYSIMRFYRIYKEVNPDYTEIKFFDRDFKLTPVTIGGYRSGFNPKKQKYLNFYCNAIYTSDEYLGAKKKIKANIYDYKDKLIASLKPSISYVGDYLASYTFTLDDKSIQNIKELQEGKYKIEIDFSILNNKKIINKSNETSYFEINHNKEEGSYTSMPTYLLDLPTYLSYNYMADRYSSFFNVMDDNSIKTLIDFFKERDKEITYFNIDMVYEDHGMLPTKLVNKYFGQQLFSDPYSYDHNWDTIYKNRARYMNQIYDQFLNTKIQLMTDSVLFDKRKKDWNLQFYPYIYDKQYNRYRYYQYEDIRGDKLFVMSLGVDYQRYNKFFPKYKEYDN